MKLRTLYAQIGATDKIKIMFEFSMNYYEYDNIEDYFDRDVYGIRALEQGILGIILSGRDR